MVQIRLNAATEDGLEISLIDTIIVEPTPIHTERESPH